MGLEFLVPAGVEDVRGIALNSTHYASTADARCSPAAPRSSRPWLRAGIEGKKVVVNTSSNGRPFLVFAPEAPGKRPRPRLHGLPSLPPVRHPPGIPPTTQVADPRWGLSAPTPPPSQTTYVDGYLWFGRPWLYRQNSPVRPGRASWPAPRRTEPPRFAAGAPRRHPISY